METTPGVRPVYVPADLHWDAFPEWVRFAIVQLCDPLYMEFVLKTRTPAERHQGAQVCFLAFLLVLSQCRIGEELRDSLQGAAIPFPSEETLMRHLQLATSQKQAMAFLLRLRRHFATEERLDAIAAHEAAANP